MTSSSTAPPTRCSLQHHTDREYEEQLERLRALLLTMAGQVEQMIGRAMQAFIDRDVDLASQTIAADSKVNADELEADQMCLLILGEFPIRVGQLQ